MRKVRPTLRVLRSIPDSLLPIEVTQVFARARGTDDLETKWRILSELRLYDLKMNLLEDARSRLNGKLPDSWQDSREKLGFPVYEVRDRTGQAWRGGVILIKEDPPVPDDSCHLEAESSDRVSSISPWMVYANTHTLFLKNATKSIGNLHTAGNLHPRPVDYQLREVEDQEINARERKRQLLHALLNALQEALTLDKDAPVNTADAQCPEVSLSVAISDVPKEGWDVSNAHEYADILSLTMVVTASNNDARNWVLETCIPFLQPDENQREPHWANNRMTVSMLLTRARLTQLLANGHSQDYVPPANDPPAPTVLHYAADKSGITQAFVYGSAVRAVCGRWWIPVGDATTHDLPICRDCEADLPAAQALKNLLRK